MKYVNIFCRVQRTLRICFLSTLALALAASFIAPPAGAGIPIPTRKPAAMAAAPAQKAKDWKDTSDKKLSGGDIAAYKKIFALQAEGKMKEADAEIEKISNPRLIGHVLQQRYLHPNAYKSSFEELRVWMDRYADHPGAQKIYNMAASRKPKGFSGTIKKPVKSSSIARVREPTIYAGKIYQSPRQRSAQDSKSVQASRTKISRLIQNGSLSKAQQLLKDSAERLDSAEYDILQGELAGAYLYRGKVDEAYKLATASVSRSGQYAPQAGWVAGLIAWRGGNYQQAAGYFEVPASSPYAGGWLGAAGSYWAARAHMRTGDVKDVSTWLKKARKHPRTFYGLLATRALGQDFDFNWKMPTFTGEYYDLLNTKAAGRRAMALVDAGQMYRAESELLRMNISDEKMRDALLAYAGYVNLPSLSMRLGSAIPDAEEGGYYDAALYPVVPWAPKDGFKIDAALIYAIARQESRFDPAAESESGARGLMQLMPATAGMISGDRSYKDKNKHLLFDPQINLGIAQLYIADLLKEKAIKGDMLSLIIAYNAGPGNLSRWRSLWRDVEDPLLFIELVPSLQTRTYVERVLANYWIYRMRDNLPTSTLDAVAEGRPALYAHAG